MKYENRRQPTSGQRAVELETRLDDLTLLVSKNNSSGIPSLVKLIYAGPYINISDEDIATELLIESPEIKEGYVSKLQLAEHLRKIKAKLLEQRIPAILESRNDEIQAFYDKNKDFISPVDKAFGPIMFDEPIFKPMSLRRNGDFIRTFRLMGEPIDFIRHLEKEGVIDEMEMGYGEYFFNTLAKIDEQEKQGSRGR